MSGTRLAERYELIERIGTGGMAEVWRALLHGEAGFRRPVAIKRVLPNLATQQEFAAMFVEEARVVSMLQHPNLVQVHDFVRDAKGRFFIVMELVEGLDLGRWILHFVQRGEPTPWRVVAAVGAQIARGLAAAHGRTDEQGQPAPIFHRDVTPSNVLLGVHGTAKLTDFGLARAMDRVTMTTPGVVKGKLAYVAPELVSGQRASAGSDLYSLGVVLWEALAGRRLFGQVDDMKLFMLVGQGAAAPLAEHRAGRPPALYQVIERAMARRPEERFASGLALADALGAVLRAEGADVDPVELGTHVADVRRAMAAG